MAYLQQSEVNGLRLGRGYGGYVNSTAFGRCALNSTNSYSTGIGYKVGQRDTVGSTFIGALAGQYVTGSFGYPFGNNNTAAGFGALQGNSTNPSSGAYNIAVGFRAFNCAETLGCNIAIGSLAFECGYGAYAGRNTMIGASAGRCLTGYDNVVLGVEAGCSLDAFQNVIIGHRAGKNFTGGKKNVVIGRCAGYTNTYDEVIIIGTDVSVTDNFHIVWGNSNNNVYNCVWGGGWSYFSDARDKTDIEPLTCNTGIKFIKKLRPVSFNFDNRKNYVDKCNFTYGQKDGTLAVEKKEYGFIAQELKQALEELNITDFYGLKYNEDKDAYRLAYTSLLAPLTKAIQELDERTQALKLKIGI
jgi:hypothetical protein